MKKLTKKPSWKAKNAFFISLHANMVKKVRGQGIEIPILEMNSQELEMNVSEK